MPNKPKQPQARDSRLASRVIGPALSFRWVAEPMRAKIGLADKHALLDAMDAFQKQA